MKGMRQEHHTNVVTSHTHARAKLVTAFVLLSQGKDSLCDRGDVSPKLRININPTRLLFESCNNYYVYIWLLYRYKCLTKNHTRGHVCMYIQLTSLGPVFLRLGDWACCQGLSRPPPPSHAGSLPHS